MSEQGWEDIPLFGEPDAVIEKRVLSKREQDDATKVQWARYRGPMVPCADQTSPDPRVRCRPVAWLRTIGATIVAVCSRHKQEYIDRQTLDTPRGQQ